MTWRRHPTVSPAPGDFVGSTAAAAIAGMGYGNFRRLIREGNGPSVQISEDGKEVFDPTETRLWGEGKGWRKSRGGRRKEMPARLHICLATGELEQWQSAAKHLGLNVSELIREAVWEYIS